jgi:hypothetical protein
MVLGIAVLPFYAVFFAGIISKLRESDREHHEGWGIAALGGAILIGAGAGVGDSMSVVLFLRGGDGLDESTVRAIYDLLTVAYGSVGIAVATLAVSVAVPAIRHRFWPDWYGWLPAVVAAVGFVSVAGVAWTSTTALVLGYGAFTALLVWTLATSILMYREG